MMTALAVGAGNVGGGSGALSVVQAYCSSDTKQSAYKVAAAFAAEKAKPRRVGGRRGGGRGWGMVHRDRGKEAERLGARKTEGTRESQWYQRVGIVYTELIKTSPFNTPFPLARSRTNTRTNTRVAEAYAHAAYARDSA
ncbi:hypothetical protein X777_13217 [Ooceraea biroi]|uniref:Uncharacterized protein n=1 Tax=Ooceraea biroi TaxID=2015173 RepID=A0A026VXQ0_OOCBI|nr:hypothetical protein X777_13217 [Ooceraea biroi]